MEGLRKGARMEEWDSIMFDRICNYRIKGVDKLKGRRTAYRCIERSREGKMRKMQED